MRPEGVDGLDQGVVVVVVLVVLCLGAVPGRLRMFGVDIALWRPRGEESG